MIAKAMEWIRENTKPVLMEADGAQWSNRKLDRVESIQTLDMVNFYTLTSLVDYLRSEVDVPNDFVKHLFVNVVSPESIAVYSEANKDNHYKRTQIAKVSAMLPVVKVGTWVDQTEFCIMMRANFIDNGPIGENGTSDTDRDALIGVASNITQTSHT